MGARNTLANGDNAMTIDRDAALLKIATDILDLETLETRRRDCLDFKEHGVFSIKRALEAAYAAGAASAAKPKRSRKTGGKK